MLDFNKFIELLFEKQEISVKQKKEIKYILDGFIKPYEGHPIFEVNPYKKEIRIAELEPIDTVHLHHWKEQLSERNIIKSSNCLYFTALNIENLMKKLNKISDEFNKYKYISSEKQVVNKNRKIKFMKTDN